MKRVDSIYKEKKLRIQENRIIHTIVPCKPERKKLKFTYRREDII